MFWRLHLNRITFILRISSGWHYPFQADTYLACCKCILEDRVSGGKRHLSDRKLLTWTVRWALLPSPAACWAFSPACSGWSTLCHPGPASDTPGWDCTETDERNDHSASETDAPEMEISFIFAWVNLFKLTWVTRGDPPGCSAACWASGRRRGCRCVASWSGSGPGWLSEDRPSGCSTLHEAPESPGPRERSDGGWHIEKIEYTHGSYLSSTGKEPMITLCPRSYVGGIVLYPYCSWN